MTYINYICEQEAIDQDDFITLFRSTSTLYEDNETMENFVDRQIVRYEELIEVESPEYGMREFIYSEIHRINA